MRTSQVVGANVQLQVIDTALAVLIIFNNGSGLSVYHLRGLMTLAMHTLSVRGLDTLLWQGRRFARSHPVCCEGWKTA